MVPIAHGKGRGMDTFGFGGGAIGADNHITLPLGGVVFTEDLNINFFPKRTRLLGAIFVSKECG